MDAYIQQILVLIDQFEAFLNLAIVVHLYQTHELPDTMINMGDKVPNFQGHHVF